MSSINWSLIRHIFGVLLLMEAFFMGISTLVGIYYHYEVGDQDWLVLLSTTLVTAVIGYGMFLSSKNFSTRITTREGFFVVSLAWVVFCLLGMIPFLLTGICPSFGSAFLEAMSGFTTTGSTTIVDLDSVPHGIMFWRHLMQWLGGLGIVVISLALIPLIGAGATQVFSAETNGLRVDKLRPKIQETALRLWSIYLGLSVVNAVLYWLGDMSWFDAVCHTFSTMASGGFSTHASSIGYFQSSYIEYVCIIFLFITSVNYNLIYFVGLGHFRLAWKNEELRWFTYFVLGFTILFMILDYLTVSGVIGEVQDVSVLGDGTWETRFRTSLFHTLTIISSAGYQAQYFDYVAWGHVFWIPTLMMMVMGGCSSSTAGGLKVVRFVVLFKNAKQEIFQALNPRSVSAVRLNGYTLSHNTVFKILAMLSIYAILLIVSVFVLQCMGLSFDTSIGCAVTALGNTGPALGQAGPAFTWAFLPDAAKWYLSLLMLIGRLEIFTVIVLFSPTFWKR